MQPIRSSSTATAALLALSMILALSSSVAARADRQAVPIGWHPQSGMAGAVGSGAAATLVRRDKGVSFTLKTANLRPGNAYTLWFVVVNNPSACTTTPCSGPDIILNPATNSQVTYGAGHIAGGNGQATFAGAFGAGGLPDGWLAGRGLEQPLTAQIHLVLNDHGSALAAYLPDMIQTYRGGCSDASPFPPIFPATALMDGEPGPNTCLLYQVAVFPTP
jgi:hypothetical protein